MAYPLRNRLRTGMTLAMFTLVVFTLVVGITTPSSFIASANKTEFVRRRVRRACDDVARQPDHRHDVGALQAGGSTRAVRRVASVSTIPVEAGTPSKRHDGAPFVDYPVHGLDDAYLEQPTRLGAGRTDTRTTRRYGTRSREAATSRSSTR